MEEFTVAEACGLLEPRMTPKQLREIIRAIGMQPAGVRKNGHVGRPRASQYTYDWQQLAELHHVLQPFLQRASVQ